MKSGFIQKDINRYIHLISPGLENTGLISHGFSTRREGVSGGVFESLNLGFNRGDKNENVIKNFQLACAALGMEIGNLTFSKQIHSDEVRTVHVAEDSINNMQKLPCADALITNRPGLPLAVFFADCVPILLLDPKREVIAAVHSGWRGTALGIAEKAVEKMQEVFSSRPSDILAAIGPCIGRCCYKVGNEVEQAFVAGLGEEAEAFFSDGSDNACYLDLTRANGYILKRAGLRQENIGAADTCTFCEKESFFSHRRDGELRGNQAAFIMLKPKGAK